MQLKKSLLVLSLVSVFFFTSCSTSFNSKDKVNTKLLGKQESTQNNTTSVKTNIKADKNSIDNLDKTSNNNSNNESSNKESKPKNDEKDKNTNTSKNNTTPKDTTDSSKNKKPDESKFEVLKLGSKGQSVKLLQKKLNKFGYNLSVDGIFGKGTKFAICDFQKRNKLKVTGMADVKTFDKLKLAPTKETTYKPAPSKNKNNGKTNSPGSNNAERFINGRNSNSPTGYYIWVSTKTPRVYVFKKSNNQWKLVKNMPCTVGKSSTPTIKGTFHVGHKGNSFIVKNNPKLMCKYYTQIQGNYLFHSILLRRNGSVANATLGAKISHGCVRLSMNDALFIHDIIPRGTTIYIN